jgi:adenylate kinase
MFRDHVSRGTDLGRKVDAILATGDYVPDEITVAMLSERIARGDAQSGYILDGFPRTEAQVESLDRLLGEHGLDRVVVLQVDADELISRLHDRGRADDTEKTISNRFQMYLEQTQPLIDMYHDRGLNVEVDGIGEVEDVTDRILTLLS